MRKILGILSSTLRLPQLPKPSVLALASALITTAAPAMGCSYAREHAEFLAIMDQLDQLNREEQESEKKEGGKLRESEAELRRLKIKLDLNISLS